MRGEPQSLARPIAAGRLMGDPIDFVYLVAGLIANGPDGRKAGVYGSLTVEELYMHAVKNLVASRISFNIQRLINQAWPLLWWTC